MTHLTEERESEKSKSQNVRGLMKHLVHDLNHGDAFKSIKWYSNCN